MAHQILGHRRLRDLDAQLPEFPVNPRRTPEGVGARHATDQRSDLRGDGRAAWPVPAALPGPEELEAGPMPPDHGLGFDQGKGVSPAAPRSAPQDPDRMKRLAIPYSGGVKSPTTYTRSTPQGEARHGTYWHGPG